MSKWGRMGQQSVLMVGLSMDWTWAMRVRLEGVEMKMDRSVRVMVRVWRYRVMMGSGLMKGLGGMRVR